MAGENTDQQVAHDWVEISIQEFLGLTSWEVAWIELRLSLRKRRKARLYKKRARNFARSIGANKRG